MTQSRQNGLATFGVIGDVHLFWDDADVDFFNGSGYDHLIFVGDIAGYGQAGGLRVARSIARLNLPTFVLPGNHDGVHAMQLLSEILPRARTLRHVFSAGQKSRCKKLDQALGTATMVGYSRHRLGFPINVICGRPHSIGGRRVACVRHLAAEYGVGSMESSANRLCELIDECDEAPLLFVSHNGPFGLGARANDIWGCDFRGEDEDWGDPDLEMAIRYATTQGRTVLGVVAGHMHRRSKKGGRRPDQLERDGILYVNAAEVPRHRKRNGATTRHHVRLTIDGTAINAQDVWV